MDIKYDSSNSELKIKLEPPSPENCRNEEEPSTKVNTDSASLESNENTSEPCVKKSKLCNEHVDSIVLQYSSSHCPLSDYNDLNLQASTSVNGAEHSDGNNITSNCTKPSLNNITKDHDQIDNEDKRIDPSLKEFYLLDESNGSEGGESDALSDTSSNNSILDNVPDEEIEALLEEGIADSIKPERKRIDNAAIKKKLFELASRYGKSTFNEVEGKSSEMVSSETINSERDLPNESHSNHQDTDCGKVKDDTVVEQSSSKDNQDHEVPVSNALDAQKFSDDNEDGCRVFKIVDNDQNELEYEVRPKFILDEIEQNHFDLLPEGWAKVNHRSGLPLYLHKKSRVCTVSRPYFLGPGSIRNHNIPLSAIPCLQYRRALKNEEQKKKTLEENQKEGVIVKGPTPLLHCARIETVEENRAAQSLSHKEVRDYCSSLYRFKSINSVKYKCWGTRKLMTLRKEAERQQRPTLPDGTKLLRFELRNPDGTPTDRPQKEWVMNPAGKSYVCILHEYVQHALKSQPSYEFKELQNPATPYSAEISIDGISYGKAVGTSKKQAKSLAAKAALEILIPDMRSKIDPDAKTSQAQGQGADAAHLSIFDMIRIEDPRVIEFCNKTTEPSPYTMLLTCLQRNHTLPNVGSNYVVSKKKNKRNEFTLTVGDHSATVVCKNKRDGKQQASQAILQALHPHVTTWGSLLRLYGNRSVKNVKEKKQQEKEITLLQSKASLNKPNFAILDKLKTEMQKLHEQRNLLRPIGRFVPPEGVSIPCFSSTDLDKLNLRSSNPSTPAIAAAAIASSDSITPSTSSTK